MDNAIPQRRTSQSLAAEAVFRARLSELGATLLEPAWLGWHKPHRVRCAAGHECKPRPGDIRSGKGICKPCGCLAAARRKSHASEIVFRAHLAEIGATLLEPTWLGVTRPHRLRCAAGHECSPRPHDVHQGHGICQTCARNNPAVAEARFKALLAEQGAVLLEPAWLGNGKPHRVRCAAGHERETRPSYFYDRDWVCQTCAGRRIRDAFYVVATATGDHLKFGVTSGDPRQRLAAHRRDGYTVVIRLVTKLTGRVAVDTEDACLEALRLAGLKPIRGREYFDGAALALVLDIADNYLPTERKAA
ncbi:hypothetical protein [Arthrobacter sp.]|uniref:hypothetical protein n=1 Tax=Arthrobacter sp. TaxID=1667 RepID=UPI002589C6CF|nr:hypothetical protein [Arthrobacter sp.]